MIKLNLINLTILLLIVNCYNCKDKLIFVIEQYRHGARGTLHGEYLGNTTPEDNYMSG